MPSFPTKFKRFSWSSAAAYGRRRLHAVLQTRGIRCGRKRVVRLMQAQGRQATLGKRGKPTTTSSDPTARFAPNLLDRDFTASLPNAQAVTDITAIPTAEGGLSLAVVLNLIPRMVVGRAKAAPVNEHLGALSLPMTLASTRPQPR